jgi:cytoskeletal protein CcmA (bactofilin family)
MASSATVIGRTTRVRGRLSGEGDFQIEGLVMGEIVAGGNVTIDTHGMVGANVRGRRLVVRGAVQGDLLGEEAVVLEEGARVVGDVKAPRVAIAHGALMRGQVQTADDDSARPAGRAAAAKSAPAQPARAPTQVIKAAAPSKVAPVSRAATAAGASGGASGPSARRPPPPVVPVLKKTKGQMLKKKER